MRGRIHALAVVALTATPQVASAASSVWCVDQNGTSTAFPGCDPCDGTTTSIELALADARANANPEGNVICVGTAPHVESVEIDYDAALGAQLSLEFWPETFDSASASALCPSASAPASEPVIRVLQHASTPADASVTVTNLHMQDGLCAATGHPLASTDGPPLSFAVSRIFGGGAPVLALSGSASGGFNASTIQGIDGPLVAGSGAFHFTDSEASGFRSAGAPVVALGAAESTIQIRDSLFFDLHSSAGAPILDLDGGGVVDSLTLAGAQTSNAPIVRWTPGASPGTSDLVLSEVVISRSFIGDASPLSSAVPAWRPYAAPGPESVCIPWGADQWPSQDRPSAPPPAAFAGEALIEVAADQLPGHSPASLTVNKSYFVENILGDGGALLRVSGTLEELVVALVNSLAADPKQLPVFAPSVFHILDASGSGPNPRTRFVSARNALLGIPTASLGPAWSQVEVTLDAVETGGAAWLAEFGLADGIVGPAAPAWDWSDPFLSEPEVIALDQCEQMARVCPDQPDICTTLSPTDTTFCAADQARNYIPRTSIIAAGSPAWPWGGSALPATDEGDPLGAVGPWGGSCQSSLLVTDTGTNAGDGDGFSNVTDCNNNSPSVTPSIPACNGFDELECTSNACYSCPYGDVAGCPLGDDDDSASGDDDDSSATDDDDSAPTDDDDSAATDDDDSAATDDDDSAVGDDDDDVIDDDDVGPDDDDSAATDDDDSALDDDDLSDDDDSAVADDDDAVFDPDVDGDGYPASVDCDDTNDQIFPGQVDPCDGVDDDCSGSIADAYLDTDGDDLPDCADPDDDDDGFNDGFDCDATDPLIFPTAPEACDAIDSDCDGDLVDGFDNLDGDAEPDCVDPDVDGDGAANDLDCAPTDPQLHPAAAELCDGLDTDCDGTLPLDERDPDGDGFLACDADCDDTDDQIHPDAEEACDGVDNDCDPATALPGELDNDGDGVLVCAGDCDDSDPQVFPGQLEVCNGVNDDCEASTNEVEDGDGDGLSLCDEDCDDSNAMVFPGAEELCDGFDNDCDPTTDEAADADGDGFSLCDGDCDDGASVRYPGAPEECNGRDDDCAGDSLDDEQDADADGWRLCHEDCDDADPAVHPSAQEECDAIDQDCDGDLLEHFEDRDGDGIPICLDDTDVVIDVGPEGCTAPEGCAVGWDPGALALVLPWFGWRRRRATRSRARPRSARR